MKLFDIRAVRTGCGNPRFIIGEYVQIIAIDDGCELKYKVKSLTGKIGWLKEEELA